MSIVTDCHRNDAGRYACAQAGCRVCVENLLQEHDGLIHAVMRQQCSGEMDYADVIQEGRIGLWRAILGFDAERGYAFSTYAWIAIRNRIWNCVKRSQKPKGWQAMEEAPDHLSVIWMVWQGEQIRQAICAELECLPKRLRKVIVQAYGLGKQPPKTLAAIGQEMGLTGERVRQLRNEGLAILRLPAISGNLRRVCEQDSREAYRKAGRLNQAWQRSRRGKR